LYGVTSLFFDYYDYYYYYDLVGFSLQSGDASRLDDDVSIYEFRNA